MPKRRIPCRDLARYLILILGIGGCIGVVLFVEDRNSFFRDDARDEPANLTRPLRLEITREGGFDEFLLGLRAYHYRTRPKTTAEFVDIYYDTPDWKLFRNGYSYRFRIKLTGKKAPNYSLRLEQQTRFVADGVERLDVTSDVQGPIGDAIAAGNWQNSVIGKEGLTVTYHLQDVLRELALRPADISPRLRAELRDIRLWVTDKGVNWFELAHQMWVFQPFEQSQDAPSFELEDIVVTTQLETGDPELIRRVRTMNEFATMIHGVRPSPLVPLERVIERLAGA